MTQNNILCTKPSIYLNELRKLASASSLGISNDFLKMKFIKGLPESIRANIVTYQSDSLDEMARVADMLISYSGNSNVSQVKSNSNATSSNNNNNSFNNFNNRSHRNPMSNANSSFKPVVYNDASIPIGIRSFHEKQRPKVCRSHLYYGEAARNCKPWCVLKSSSNNILPSSRPPSRSSSPAPNQSQQMSGN